MSGEPLDQLLDAIDPGASYLQGLPDRLWVFGGPCNDSSRGAGSLRDYFWRQALTSPPLDWYSQLDRPENHPDWWAFSGYGDLLEFERDACYLARGTILFAESPGSLAELGALALDSALLPRLFVVVPSLYLNDENRESFLNLGPLRRVHKNGYRCIISARNGEPLSAEDFETITESVSSWVTDSYKTTLFNPNNPTHRLLLIADLVDLFLIVKLSDLHKALRRFLIEITEQELMRVLSLLHFFRLIKIEYRGTEPFFLRRISSDAPWVNYTAKHGSRFDRSRFKTTCLQWIDKNPRLKGIFHRPQ